MTILLVLLILLFILVILNLYIPITEGFDNPQLATEYNTFLTTYLQFCTNWQKGIISAIAINTPKEPSNTVTNNQAPQPSAEEMNLYITQLSQQMGKPLPPICNTLPGQLDSTTLSQVIPLIPSDPQPIINALNWMNDNLNKAISNLSSALNPQIESFQDSCQNVSQCIANNPQLAQQIAQQIAQQQTQTQQQLEQELLQKLQSFNTSASLQKALQTNQQLMQQSQEIQRQAQSGELLKQVNIPSTPRNPYIVPEGGNNLAQMKEQNPQQYDDYKKNYGQWFSIKQLMEQINSTL